MRLGRIGSGIRRCSARGGRWDLVRPASVPQSRPSSTVRHLRLRSRDAGNQIWKRTVSEQDHERNGGVMNLFETLSQDVRYGVRTLRRNSSFTIVSILALA